MATINKRGDRWQLNWSDAEGQHRVSLGKVSQQEAEVARREKELELLTGRRYSVHSVSFADFAAEYLTWYAQHFPSTYERTDGIFRHSLLPYFGHLPLDQLRHQDVTGWLLQRKASPKPPAPATISKEARTLAAMMRKAVEWGQIHVNPIAGAKAPPERQSKAPQYYSREELARLYIHSGRYAPVWRFMANTGLRRNEALYLKKADIEPDAIRVQSLEDRPTKSRRWRLVPLNAAAKEAIAAMENPSAYLLPRIDPRSLSRAFLKAAARADLPGSLHTLRHTFISHLVMAGVDLATVQKIAGHASISTTMRYAHLSQAHAQAAIAKIAL